MAKEQYQVLARKYRPKNFGELLGQEHVAKALSNAIDTGRLHHAYLFTGTRGVGKTTIARILAKCLNCETGVTSQPCGVCDTCVSIDQGRFIDLIEIDAASRTKVEDTRELLENVPYAPTQGRYKVYLIDEVHMLSTHSFNALLKTLEEPPEHAKFIFATTDPQKLPITIISRCLQFVLRPMSQASLSEHLQKILTLENVPFTAPAVWQLAAAAKGSVRDSLSLTDQAIAFGGGQIGDETVNQMLGLLDGLDVVGLLTAILHDQRTAVAAYIEQLRLQMVDVLAVFDRLIDAVYQSALMQTLPDLPTDMNAEQRASLLAFAEQISGDVLQLYYEILIKGRESVRLANTPMQALEMSILRLLAFRPLMQNEIAVPDEQAKLVPSHQHDTVDNAPNSAQVTPITIDHTVDGADNTNTADNTDIIQIDAAVRSDASQSSSLPMAEMVDEQMADDLQATQNHMALSANQPINQVNSQTDSHNTQSDSQTSEQADSQSDNQPNEQTQTDTALTDELLPSMVVLANDDLHADKQIKSHHTDDIDAMGIETMGDDEPLDAIHSQNTDKHIIDNNANTVVDSHADDLIDNQADYQTDYQADSLADDADKTADNTIDNEQNQPNINPADTHQVALPSADLSAPATFNRTQMLAKLQPPATDTTEWTPTSWDYWLYQARQKQVFDADELALLDNALMTGDFVNSQLMVSEQNSQIEMSFAGVLHKISHHFREIQLADQLTIGDIHNKTPRFFREGRMEQVRIDAQNQLIQSPVFGKLWELGFIIDDDQPVLLSSKLTID